MFVYDKDGNRLEQYHQISEKEAKTIHGEDAILSEVDCGKNAVVENGVVRAKTRLEKILSGEEELQDGEYIENEEIVVVVKPSNYHYWNSETNEWIHDKELEINSLEEELGTLELNIFNKQNEIEVLKKVGKNFAAKKLEKEVAELEKLFEEKLARYEELEGEQE